MRLPSYRACDVANGSRKAKLAVHAVQALGESLQWKADDSVEEKRSAIRRIRTRPVAHDLRTVVHALRTNGACTVLIGLARIVPFRKIMYAPNKQIVVLDGHIGIAVVHSDSNDCVTVRISQ